MRAESVAWHERPILRQFLRFAAVGLCGTAAHYAVLGALVEFARVPVLWATTAGFTTGALVNYVLNRRFTFDSEATHAVALTKFLTICAIGAVINWLIVAALVQYVSMHYFIAQLFSTATVLLWNFLGNYLWTFRR